MKQIYNRSNNGEMFFKKYTKRFILHNTEEHSLLGTLVVSKEKKTIFMHIAKSGGSSIHRWLTDNGYDDGICGNREVAIEEQCLYFEDVCNELEKYCIFTSFRYQPDLVVSLFYYDAFPTNYLHKKLFAYCGLPNAAFDDFLENILGANTLYGSLIDSHAFVTEEGKSLVDYVIDFENLESSFEIFSKMGLGHIGSLPHANKGLKRRKMHMKKLEMTHRRLELIKNKFEISSMPYDDFCNYLNSL